MSINIAILDNFLYMRSRIKKMIMENEMDVFEAENSIELLDILSKHKMDLILMEVNLKDEDGFAIIKKVKAKYEDIPVIILTTENKINLFSKGMEVGAIDYILKPFENEFLIERIMKNLKHESQSYALNTNMFSLSFEEYLISELRKAKKGNYEVAIFMSTIFKPLKKFTKEMNDKYIKLSDLIYPKFKELFWETDILLKYGSQSFLIILPFCDENNTKIINKKINDFYYEFRENNILFKEYYLENVFVTFPIDGENREELFSNLIMRMKEKIKIRKNMKKEDKI